jgi:N-acetylglucosamine-6-phosphate deacetylase
MTVSNRSSGIALRHATVIDGERILADRTVMIRGDRIEAIIPDLDYSDDREMFDVRHAFVAPGFIDLQLNGAGGALFNDAISAETLAVMQRTNLRSGTTGFLPTLITTSEANMGCALDAGIPLLEAVRMATLYPARIIGREDELGRIAPGYLANLAVFDQNFTMLGVVDHGTWLPLPG